VSKSEIELNEISCSSCGWKGKIADLHYNVSEKKYKYICPKCGISGQVKLRKK